MNFNIPKIVKPLYLKAYAEQFEEQAFYVWVNPPSALLDELNKAILSVNEVVFPQVKEGKKPTQAQIEAFNAKIEESLMAQLKVYSQLLSQGETQCSADELHDFTIEMADTDPALWSWVKTEIAHMIQEHRSLLKKA